MAAATKRHKIKLIAGIMYSDEDMFSKVEGALIKKFGAIEHIILTYPFNFTDYYSNEMGKKLRKTLIVFNKLVDRDRLAEIKLFTNSLESRMSKKGKRSVNIDPGYMTLHNVVLASAKEMPHRPWIGKGIFADVVLRFKDNKYHDSETTFPDYKMMAVKEFLYNIRENYSKQLKELK